MARMNRRESGNNDLPAGCKAPTFQALAYARRELSKASLIVTPAVSR
jgi:hypothetical protein